MQKGMMIFKIEDYRQEPFNIVVPKSYIRQRNHETGLELPNCCPFHLSVFELSKSWYEKFPDCCDKHRKLARNSRFDKEYYKDVPQKIVDQLALTEFYIEHLINDSDWFESITDYIEYNVQSFGIPEVGSHLYLANLKASIKALSNVTIQEKKESLIEFVESYLISTEEEVADINVLNEIFESWLTLFPFELNSYFGDLKAKFENQFPMNIAKLKRNRYTGLLSGKIHTKSSLILALREITENLLHNFNGVTMFERGLVRDLDKLKIELILNSRKQQLKTETKYETGSEIEKFNHVINQWFEREKQFWNEMSPYVLLEKSAVEGKRSLKEIALIHVYEGKSISRNNSNLIAKQFGHSSGEKLFQLFTKFSSKSNRIGDESSLVKNKNKLGLLEQVKGLVKPEFQSKVEDEIRIFKSRIN